MSLYFTRNSKTFREMDPDKTMSTIRKVAIFGVSIIRSPFRPPLDIGLELRLIELAPSDKGLGQFRNSNHSSPSTGWMLRRNHHHTP